MRRRSKIRHRSTLAVAFLLPLAIVLGCQDKGPVEKAGEGVDKVVRALDPRGPMEKAGAKIDNATKP